MNSTVEQNGNGIFEFGMAHSNRLASLLQEDVRERIGRLNVWKKSGQRAPHKPLLLLLALSRLVHGQPRLAKFNELDAPLSGLLQRYGPPRRSYHPEYPFWRLQRDQVWEVTSDIALKCRKGQDAPLRTELLRNDVVGGLPEDIFVLLQRNRTFLDSLVTTLLDSQFPSSVQEDIRNELGLIEPVSKSTARRDTAFRAEVLRAYEHRCAVCGFDVKFGHADLAVEAAHIRWHQAGGPAIVQNGLALCVLHHKAFDRGAIGISPDLTLCVSADLYGRTLGMQWFLRFKGRPLKTPMNSQMRPCREHIDWHWREVFRQPARE